MTAGARSFRFCW